MNARQVELFSAVAIAVLVFIGFYETSQIDLTLSSELETFTGPRAYPRIILSGMLFLVCIQLGKIWIGRTKKTVTSNTLPIHPRLTKVFLAFSTLTLFTALFEPLGYLITMVPLLTMVGYLNGADSFTRTVTFSIFASVICLVIFRYGLNIVLPEGLIGIDQIF